MTLTLSITNVGKLDNGGPTSIRLERHGVTIGRSPHMDWSLPDPQAYISSSHCEVRYRDGVYTLHDTSTNGTYLKGSAERLPGARPLADGDVLMVGQYEIAVQLTGTGAAPAREAGPPQSAFTWGSPDPTPVQTDGWGASGGAAPASGADAWGAPSPSVGPAAWGQAAPASASSWGAPSPPSPAPPPASSWGEVAAKPFAEEAGGLADHWSAPAVQAPAAPAPSPWETAGPASGPAASDWSAPVSAAPASPAAADIWGSLSDVNAVDWDRGGFDRATPRPVEVPAAAPPAPAPEGLAWGAPQLAAPSAAAWGAAAPAPAPLSPTEPTPLPSAVGSGSGSLSAFLAGAGLSRGDLKGDEAQALGAAGGVLKRLVGGLVVLMEARARAKAQMGAQGTMLEFNGNNPLKFARSPEQALAQLLNPPERGFMPADLAIEDSLRDLQAHQMATLAAMQGALASTLKRFSPASIRGRAENRGVLAKILPAAREAALWQAYEREFEGVARGSDEAFMDVFAKEFRSAYEAAAAGLKAKG